MDAPKYQDHVVKISDMAIADSPRERLVTYSLGSCIGLTLYDPNAGLGGMLHALLPWSKMNPAKANDEPCTFVDTGVVQLMRALEAFGADRRRLVARIAGGAMPLASNDMFRIGERNQQAIREVLQERGIKVYGAALGGTDPRTMILALSTGKTYIKSYGNVTEI